MDAKQAKRLVEGAKTLRWPLFAFLIFILVQIGSSLICSAIAAAVEKFRPSQADTGTLVIILSLLISSVVTSIILLRTWQFGLRKAFAGLGCKPLTGLVGIAAAFCALFGADVVNEFLDLPNLAESTFISLSKSALGIFAVGIAGPVCEEIVFRGGIMRPMLNRGARPWAAILVSALLFGLVHANPAQIPFAALVGVVFGIIYYRTRSLVITTFCHIVNNSVSVLLMNRYGDAAADMTFRGFWGKTGNVVALAVAALAALALLRIFWKRTEQENFAGQDGETETGLDDFLHRMRHLDDLQPKA